MRIYANQLTQSLTKYHSVYLVLGDEPLQKMQCLDAIRQHCANNGYDERVSLVQCPQFRWSQLTDSSQNLSLFSQRQLIELELTHLKPGQEGSKALTRFLAAQTSETTLLIHGPKATSDSQKSKWFKALESKGLYVAINVLEGYHFTQWLKQATAHKQLNITPDALHLLAQMFEGNQLAASQELDKLALQVGQQPIDITTLKQRVSNQARFNLFELQDALLIGNTSKVITILGSLQREDIEPQLLFWAFHRDLALLLRLKIAQLHHQSPTAIYQQARVWSSRQKLFDQALQRLALSTIQRLLGDLAEIETAIKMDFTLPWHHIVQLALDITGE